MRDDLVEAAFYAEFPYDFANYWVDVFMDVMHDDDINVPNFLRYLDLKAPQR